jgi:four helix bundle protein
LIHRVIEGGQMSEDAANEIPITALDQADALKARTKQFALRILTMCHSLPAGDQARMISRQVMRSATSMAANYRAVCRARSKAEFISKLGVVIEEADETVFWLELLVEAGVMPQRRMAGLVREANELLAIFGASVRTAKLSARHPMNQ